MWQCVLKSIVTKSPKITPGLLIPFPAKIINLIQNCASEPSPSLPRAPLHGTLASHFRETDLIQVYIFCFIFPN